MHLVDNLSFLQRGNYCDFWFLSFFPVQETLLKRDLLCYKGSTLFQKGGKPILTVVASLESVSITLYKDQLYNLFW